MDNISILIEWIKESQSIVFFGGAGVSTESGLKDFRSADGIYQEENVYPPEEILSHTFFLTHTEEFFQFYREKLNPHGYKPNICHFVLKKMEDIGKLNAIVTQNIDGFHEDAGSKNILNIHGTVKSNHCMNCGKYYSDDIIFQTVGIPYCHCGGIIKPDVVLYEESLDLDTMRKAIFEISHADLLIVGGTSLNVYPAAGFLEYFHGKHIVLINRSKTNFDSKCDLVIHDSIGSVFTKIEEEIFPVF